MSSQRRSRKSTWLAPALGAGLGTAAAGLGYGSLSPLAHQLGMSAGQYIKRVTGFGEYQIRSNALYEGAQVPFVRNDPLINGTTVSHKEFIMDVVTSDTIGDFKSQQFDLNVALRSTFPWLSQISANYEEYSLEGCLLCFRSMSADALNSTNTSLGTIIMATQYNTYQPVFSNKAEMEAHAYSMSGRPSEDLVHPIECDPHQSTITTFFTRTGSVPDSADQRLYDVGRFEIATTGFQAASVNIGELHITYQVTLGKPRMYTGLGRGTTYWHGVNMAGFSGSQPFGTLPMPAVGTTSNFTPPDQSYVVDGANTLFVLNMPQSAQPLVFCIQAFHEFNAVTALSYAFDVTGGIDVTAGYMGDNGIIPESTIQSVKHTKYSVVRSDGSYAPMVVRIGMPTGIGASAQPVNLFISQYPVY